MQALPNVSLFIEGDNLVGYPNNSPTFMIKVHHFIKSFYETTVWSMNANHIRTSSIRAKHSAPLLYRWPEISFHMIMNGVITPCLSQWIPRFVLYHLKYYYRVHSFLLMCKLDYSIALVRDNSQKKLYQTLVLLVTLLTFCSTLFFLQTFVDASWR